LYHRRGTGESGLASAEKALALDPSLAEAHAAKGSALCFLGQYSLSLAAHEETLRLMPDSYEGQATFGPTCMQLGRFEDAIVHYERAAQLLETDYTCLSLVAACQLALGRTEAHKETARRSLVRTEKELAQHPDNTHAMVVFACDLADLGETERAR